MAARSLAAARESGCDITVWFAPSDAEPEMRHWLGDGCDYRPQPAGDRGLRLGTAARAAAAGRSWLALVGDCPALGAAMLAEAGAIAARGEFVIGPTTDGGYFLIGGTPPMPDIFTAMPWGTHRLLGETRLRLAHVGVGWRELAPLREVETIEQARAERLLT